jgi:DNA sulfur modification protein DndD
MKLVRLTMKNFMPYRERMIVEFPTDDMRNVMLVFGDNMRGKTSLLNALRWGFYEKALGRHSRRIPLIEIVNKDAIQEDDWRVEIFVDFEANGDVYELRRTADRRSQAMRPTRSEDLQTSILLKKNGAVVAGDQVDHELDQVAPEQTSRFFLFDGELLQEYEELLFEGSEQGRQIKEAIEQALGVPTLVSGRDELGTILKTASRAQTKALAHIQGLQAQALRTDALNERLEALEADEKYHETSITEKREERENLEDELEAAATVLALKAKLDAARGERDESTALIDRKQLERHEVLASAWKDILDARLGEKKKSLREEQRRITGEIKTTSRVEADIDRLRELIDTDVCPTCEQSVTDATREKLKATLGKMQAQIMAQKDVSTRLNEISAQLGNLEKIRGSGAGKRIAQIEKDIHLAQIRLQKAENEIEEIEEKINEQDATEIARKRTRVSDLLKEEGKLNGDLETVRTDIKKVKDELAIARKAIEGVASARAEKSTKKVTLTSDLEKVFAASIEKLRENLRGRVEQLASDAFRKMTTQEAYQGLQINDNYGLRIIDSQGRTVSMRSAGAEQVVALSLIDGLNRTGRSAGPVVMDTPFGRLDPKHRNNILSYLPTVTTQFVLFVHGGEIRRETDLEAVKDRIGAVYELVEVSETQTKIERATL